MNCKIPFTKDILFEKKVSEITSISLEHEIKTQDNILKGNFIVSGDFKCHEVSVNKEAFSYMLPFEIEIAPDIDSDTIEFMIDDFTYEVIDNSILKVNIDFNVLASKKEVVEEEPLFRDASELFLDTEELEEKNQIEEVNDFAIENITEEKEEILEEKEEEIIYQEEMENRNQMNMLNTEIVEEIKEEVLSEDTIIDSIKSTGDEYATYHIHMVSDGETIETICTMYNSNMGILSEYNDLTELNNGDKLIIPEKNE